MKIINSGEKNREPAVSPVIGIMLMLIVTVVLAAVISGYTGGLAKTRQKPPTLVFEAKIVIENTGDENSFLDINVISISEGIPSRDLKFQTEWRNDSGIQTKSVSYRSSNYPLGYGMGVDDRSPQNFGNYTILGGTRLHANGTGGGLDQIFGSDWKNIAHGTPVRLQFIHVPSGAVIADKEITSE